MSISDVTGLGGKQYRCVVTGACGLPATSAAVTLTVNSLVAITSQPTAPAAICAGIGIQTMTVAATGTGLTYRWYENGIACTNDAIHSGSTASTMTLTNSTALMNGYQYYCIITGTCAPAITSNTITLTVNSPATITVAPTAQSVCAYAANSLYLNTTNFAVTAVGAASYQWQANPGSGYVNANSAYYTNDATAILAVTNPIGSMTGTMYRCLLTTAAGCTSYTTPVAMTVNPLPTEPTWVIGTSATADSVKTCIGSLNMTLNATQGANVTYSLLNWPSLTPAVAPVTGNSGMRTWLNVATGTYVYENYNTTTGCGVIQKH